MKLVAIELSAKDRSYAQTLELLQGELTKISENQCSQTLVVLPENFLGYYSDIHSIFSMIAEIEKHNILEKLKCLAKQFNVFLVTGSLPTEEFNHRFISSYLISKEGELIAEYRKIHLFKAKVNDVIYDEGNIFSPGLDVKVVSTSLGKIGLSVCFDLRFSAQYLTMRKMGAVILAVPAAFTLVTGKKHWEVLLRSRAIENQAFVIGANLCGIAPNGYECYGHSMIIDPDGKILIRTKEYAEIQSISVEVDLQLVDIIRQNMPIINE